MMALKSCDQWDARFFTLCDLVASWSEDTSRKVGSVIVGPANEVRSTGYNGFARRVNSRKEERHSRVGGEKYLWFEHAERNAIYNLARAGASSDRCRMYASTYPCADCARAIIQSGIIELRTFQNDPSDEFFRAHYAVTEEMFLESGVNVSLYSRSDPLLANVIKMFTDQIKAINLPDS